MVDADHPKLNHPGQNLIQRAGDAPGMAAFVTRFAQNLSVRV
jgi:hypothetical protein